VTCKLARIYVSQVGWDGPLSCAAVPLSALTYLSPLYAKVVSAVLALHANGLSHGFLSEDAVYVGQVLSFI
jgi:hypothetical protein